MIGGVLLYSGVITCPDHFDEFGEIDSGYQRFVPLSNVVKPILGVDDETVHYVRDGRGHVYSRGDLMRCAPKSMALY
jgi:hypothetical protein